MKTRLLSVSILVAGLALALTWAVAAQRSSEAAVALGRPGTSFRYVETFGVTEEPYPADAQHLNGPNGISIDGSNSLYVVEEYGFRLLKFNSTGANQLVVGHAGLPWHHDDYLSWPKDMAVAGDGHIWVAMSNCLKEFDATGAVVQRFPDADPWNTGSDNEHFDEPRGVAFDSAGRMYVADRYNHRVQVYTFTLGSPVYSATIGVTGVSGSDNAHFNDPTQIAIDDSDRLYVADASNYRVQRCTYASGWACTTFHGTGSAGSGANELGIWTNGLGIDGSDNVYIADGENGRVKKCTGGGSCSTFVSGLLWPVDVAVDSTGNIYVNDDHAIRKYNSGGVFQSVFAGTSGVPYTTDAVRYNALWGIAVASDGSLYITEERGYRLVKLNAAGVQQWTVGQAGVHGSDNAHFGDPWGGPKGNLAIDATGRIYVPDTHNDRVQIFTSSGAYLATFGSLGTGPYQFAGPSGVAISPVNGDIYVVDRWNHRIQVFNSSRVYKATLGVTGVSGSDNAHFNYPNGVAIDVNGNIYVADGDNDRVQKCTLSGTGYTCITFAGVTEECGTDFDHLCGPHSVAVDASGRVYVADVYDNDRIQVFDSTGAYLTTISNSWGSNTGQLRYPAGVAVDAQGNVYVADHDNHRIQKFAPDVPGWRQVNVNGFGDCRNGGVVSLAVFSDTLYAGTSNWDGGARVWRTNDGTTWTAVSEPGFGSAYTNTNALVFDMIEFKGQLYAGTGNWGYDGVPGQIWRSSNGTTWELVEGAGFGSTNNIGITTFGVFSNTLYAATFNTTDGLEIWRTTTGNSGDWARMVDNGNGDAGNFVATGLVEFSGYFYAAVPDETDDDEIWRTYDGVTWTAVVTDGFGSADNTAGGFAIFDGHLYIGSGPEIYRSANGVTWTQVMSNGFEDSNNTKVEMLFAFDGALYAGVSNDVTGIEIWRSTDGTTWSQVNPDGFGDSNTTWTLWSVGTAAFNNRLFIGTWNWANGGEVWMLLRQVYLPLMVRNHQ